MCNCFFFWFVGMFVFTYGSFGQIVTERTKYQRSTRELWGRISDTTRLGAVPLAHVFLMDRKDTVKLVADLSGRFYYNGRLADTMQVQVTALGFKPFIGQYIPKKHGLDICVQLQQEDMMLDEVIITGKRLMMVVKGDTLKYNVDEVKTLEGAKMGEILEKLPGVSMDEGLKVNGVPIHRIYVNGDTLFKGTDALDYIAADNVKDVKVFDERNKEDLAQGLRHGRREKVMDVTTKREVTRQEIARTVFEQKRNVLTIGGGVDASRDRTSKFPEKFLMTYTYNKGRVSSSGVPRLIPEIRRAQDGLFFSVDYSNLFLDDKREFGGKFVYAKKFRGISYNSQYVYRNTTSYRNQWEELDYFPTDRFDSRRYEQISSEKNMVYKYATSQTFVFPIREINFQLSGLWTYDVNKHWKNNMMLSKLDNEIMNCANLQDYNRAYTSEGGAMLVVSTNSKKKIHSFYLQA